MLGIGGASEGGEGTNEGGGNSQMACGHWWSLGFILSAVEVTHRILFLSRLLWLSRGEWFEWGKDADWEQVHTLGGYFPG